MQDSVGQDSGLTWLDTTLISDTSEVLIEEEPMRSLFEGHLLAPSESSLPMMELPESQTWIFAVILVVILLLAVAQRGSEMRPLTMLRAAFDRGMVNHFLRYGSGGSDPFLLVMLGASAVSIALFAVTVMDRLMDQSMNFGSFVLGLLALIGVVLAFRLAHVMLGIVFQAAHLTRVHFVEGSVSLVSAGVLLLPCTVFHHYGPKGMDDIPMWTGVAIMVVLVFKDLQRTLTALWADPGISASSMFYYFCAFKILPLSVFLRITTGF